MKYSNKVFLTLLIIVLFGLLVEGGYLWGTTKSSVTVPEADVLSEETRITEDLKEIAEGHEEHIKNLYYKAKQGTTKDLFLSVIYLGTLKEIKAISQEVGDKYPWTASLSIVFIDSKDKEEIIYLSKEDLSKTKYYEKQGNKQVEIDQNELKPGDKVELLLTTDLIKHQRDNAIEISIVKIL